MRHLVRIFFPANAMRRIKVAFALSVFALSAVAARATMAAENKYQSLDLDVVLGAPFPEEKQRKLGNSLKYSVESDPTNKSSLFVKYKPIEELTDQEYFEKYGFTRESLHASLGIAVEKDPVRSAKANALASGMNMPADLVERNYDETARMRRLATLTHFDIPPKTAQFLRDLGNASQAHDDIEKLSKLERITSIVAALTATLFLGLLAMRWRRKSTVGPAGAAVGDLKPQEAIAPQAAASGTTKRRGQPSNKVDAALRDRLGWGLSAVCALLALPLSELIYEDGLEARGLFMRAYAYLLALSPVWLVMGWRWITRQRPMPARVWVGCSLSFLLLSMALASDSYLDELAGLPLAGMFAFLVLVWNYERGRMLWWRSSLAASGLSSIKDLSDAASPLIKLTEDLANQLGEELRRLSMGEQPPALNKAAPFVRSLLKATNPFLCAYALIFLNFQQHGFRQNARAVAIFAAYKTLAVGLYLEISQPRIEGVAPMSAKELSNERTSEAALNLFLERENGADLVLENLNRNAAHPFFPIYSDLRPFMPENTTVREMHDEFGPLISALNGQAKRVVAELLETEI